MSNWSDFHKERPGKTKYGPKAKILETPWGHEGMSYLRGMLGEEAPLLEVSGMSDEEKQGLDILQGILKGEAFQDPRTSPYYQGLRRESLAEQETGMAEINRQTQMGGMGGSSTAARTQGDFMSDMANQRMTLLGSLYEKERERDNPYTRAGMAFQYGGLPRAVQNEQNQAAYQQKVGTTELNSQISQILMNYQPWYTREWWQTPDQPSRFSQMYQGMMAGAAKGQESGNPYVMAGMGMGGGIAGATA